MVKLGVIVWTDPRTPPLHHQGKKLLGGMVRVILGEAHGLVSTIHAFGRVQKGISASCEKSYAPAYHNAEVSS